MTEILPIQPRKISIDPELLNCGAIAWIDARQLKDVQQVKINSISLNNRISKIAFETLTVAAETMVNLRNLDCGIHFWEPFCSGDQGSQLEYPGGSEGKRFENVEVLQLRSNSGILNWTDENGATVHQNVWAGLSQIFPNVKVYVLHADRGRPESSIGNGAIPIIESLPSFKKLKHLVLVNNHDIEQPEHRNLCDFTDGQLRNLEGMLTKIVIPFIVVPTHQVFRIVTNQ